jgi:glycerophosphoryl diester phosphodiesterase
MELLPGLDRLDGTVPDSVYQAGGVLWCPYFKDITEADLARAKELGLCVAVWTVSETDDIDAMIGLRVDANVTDYPDRVQRKLSDRGFRVEQLMQEQSATRYNHKKDIVL